MADRSQGTIQFLFIHLRHKQSLLCPEQQFCALGCVFPDPDASRPVDLCLLLRQKQNIRLILFYYIINILKL